MGKGWGWTLQQWGGCAAASLGPSCVVPAPALCFPWAMEVSSPPSESEEVDVSPPVGFPNLGKTAQPCRATPRAADVSLLGVVVSRQRGEGCSKPPGMGGASPRIPSSGWGCCRSAWQKGAGKKGNRGRAEGASRIWEVIWNASESSSQSLSL